MVERAPWRERQQEILNDPDAPEEAKEQIRSGKGGPVEGYTPPEEERDQTDETVEAGGDGYPSFIETEQARERWDQMTDRAKQLLREEDGDLLEARQRLREQKQRAQRPLEETVEPAGDGDLPGGFTREQLKEFTEPEAPEGAPLSERYPELYSDGATASGGTPLPGQFMIDAKAGVPTGEGMNFDPSDPEAVATWLSERDERAASDKMVREREAAEKRLRTGGIETPEAITNEEVLQQPVDIEATEEQAAREELRQEFASRYTEATVGDLAFEADDITLEETEEGGYQPQLTEDARSEIQQYQQQGFRQNLRETTATTISGRFAGIDVGPEDIGIQQTEEGLQPVVERSGERELLEFQREGQAALAAKQFDRQTPTTDISAGDIQLGGPQGPTLADDVQSLIQERRREQAQEEAIATFEEETGADISETDIQREDGRFTLTDETRREIAAENIRSGAVDTDIPLPTSPEAGTEAVTDQTLSQVDAEDITLTDEGPTLDVETQRQIAAAELNAPTEAIEIDDGGATLSESYQREQAAEQFDVSPSDVTLEDGQAQLTEEYQREIAAENIRSGAVDTDIPLPTSPEAGTEAVTDQTLSQVDAEDITLTDEGPTLDVETQRQIAAAELNAPTEAIEIDDGGATLSESYQREQAAEQFDVSPSDVTLEDGQAQLTEEYQREQAAEEFSERYDTDLSTGDIELTPDGPQLEPGKRDLVADLQTARAAESLEEQLQSEFAGRSKFASTTIPEEVQPGAAGELNLTSTDVTTTDSGVGLSESGRAEVRETQLDVAQGRIDRQVPIDVTEDDLTRDDGSITLSEQGRERLTDYQREQATEKLLADLRDETGADLDESDIAVTATEDDGTIEFEADLTKSGQRELAGEQVPGSDLPVIGGVLESGGEFGERINQERLAIGDEITDRLPEVEVPEVPTPSTEQIAGAAAVGVATPEPVTTGTGSLILGGIALGSLTVAGAQRLSEGLPDQARASATQDQAEIPVPTDGSTRDITEITIPTGGDFLPTEEQPTTGDAVPQRELPVGQGLQDITELSIPSQFEQVDPRTLQTGATVGESITDDTPFSPGPTLPTPGEMGEEIADRQTFERTFPTGGSAVVGRELTEDVTEPELDDATEPVLDQPTEPGVDTGTGTGTGPGTGVPPGTEPGEGIDGNTTRPGEGVQDRPLETVTPDLTPGVDALPFATPDVQGTPLLDAPAATGTTTGPGFEFPGEQGYELSEEVGYPEQYSVGEGTPSRSIKRPRIPELDLDADTDDDKKWGLDLAADEFDNEVLSPGEAADFDPFD